MFWRSGAESFEGAKKYTAPGPTPRAYGAPPAPGAYRFVIVLGATVFHSGLREGREASFAPKRPTEDDPEPWFAPSAVILFAKNPQFGRSRVSTHDHLVGGLFHTPLRRWASRSGAISFPPKHRGGPENHLKGRP